MQAVTITGHGGNEVVELREASRPVRAPGEVLVRMHAATLNPVDLDMRNSGAGTADSTWTYDLPPTVTSAAVPANATYAAGQNLELFA